MSIVNEKAVLVIAWYGLAQLLNRPFGSWERRRAAVEDATRTDLHYDEDVNDAEASCDCDHGIACQQRSGLVAHECIPTL